MAVKHPIIEHAKKMLMEKYGITEPAAHRYILDVSMHYGTSKHTIAKRIIRQLGGNLHDVAH